MSILPSLPRPLLGAHWDGQGTSFALLALGAQRVWVCLFDSPNGSAETHRVPLEGNAEGIWSVYLPEIRPGQLYGFRLQGRWNPHQGKMTHPGQLLLDPYAREIAGSLVWKPSLFASSQREVVNRKEAFSGDLDSVPGDLDTAPWVPKARVVDNAFSWGEDTPPRVPWGETVIYECHVKGLTASHPDIPPPLRGTFAGMSQAPILEHLTSLGITAVELMPIQVSITELRLANLGLTNYWGYNPLAFFAPDSRFCATDNPTLEFKELVRALHGAGIEILLDVVFNHTAEGNHQGPILHLKGMDNPSYYRLRRDDPSRYEDFSGCGNTLAIGREPARRLVLDALRYWVEEMHVDGFRFDLAPVLGRDQMAFDAAGSFFRELAQCPSLEGIKLIAEPWDLGPKGYQLGNFSPPWAQWNDRFRDSVRSFWRGDSGSSPEMATRLTGSSDFFPRDATASINLVACHDGFTLRDLVSYERRHNLANGEEGRDGHGHNLSSNWGTEGATTDPAIGKKRLKIQRNLLATLAFSRGTPLLGHGDELGRTQQGNNNAYCHDSELTWIDWKLDEERQGLVDFCREVFALRRRFRLLRGLAPLVEAPREGRDRGLWLTAQGESLCGDDWQNPDLQTFGLLLEGEEMDRLLLLFNSSSQAQRFVLPPPGAGFCWRALLDTALFPAQGHPGPEAYLQDHSLQLLIPSRPRRSIEELSHEL